MARLLIFSSIVIGIFVQSLYGQVPCPVEEDPIVLAECAQLDVQAIIQAARGNLKLFCNLAERYMECFKSKTRACIGGQFGEGALTELQNLAQWCCVNPGAQEPDECPLRRTMNCFSADDYVSMVTGEMKRLSHVQPGDRILVMDSEQKLVEDEVIMILDIQLAHPALFYSIETESGHRLSVTANHFLAVDRNDQFLAAHQLKVSDRIYINNNKHELQPVRIRNITEEYKIGYVTPLTGHGTLIVNGIAASCYSAVISHDLAHSVMAPLRWWYRISKLFSIKDPFGYSRHEGIHWIPFTMLKLTEKYLPTMLSI